MLEFDFTLIVFAISFIIFIQLLNLTLFKPVGNIVEARNNLIESDLTKSSEFAIDAEKTLEDYNSQIKNARKESMGIVEQATNNAMKVKQEKVDALSNTLSKEKDEAIKNIESEQSNAIKDLKGKIDSLTKLITNKVLGEKNLVTN